MFKRSTKAKLAVATSLFLQFVSIFCGIIVPRLMIGAYGSELYGATTSIAQFLSYIALLEGGVGGVARAALYNHIADGNNQKISRIYHEIKRIFNFIAIVFVVYTIIIASTYKYIANADFLNWSTTFILVIVISVSNLAQYLIGLPNQVLLQADQRTHIVNLSIICTTLINTVLTIILIALGSNIIVVKLVSGCVYVLRPILLNVYVHKHYVLSDVFTGNEVILKDKWVGIGQHIAFFLHTNTDTVVLTLFVDLKTVAIYSVYSLIISHIRELVLVVTSGMEGLFGDMLARKENENLSDTFDFYDTLISLISIIVFSVAVVLIIPFVKLYTASITDANYIQPLFACVFILGECIYCLRSPFHNLIIAAGRFRQTQIAAYLEAAINIILSCLLVIKFGLVGVAIGTTVSFAFRYLYYVFYLSKHIIKRKISKFAKRSIVNIITVVMIVIFGYKITSLLKIDNYAWWCAGGVIAVIISVFVAALLNILFYKNEMRKLYYKFKHRRKT